jgi:hypothetical protein
MQTLTGMSVGPVPEKAILRRPGVDFDLEGSRSTLMELFQIGGLFPLARIADRLPFSASTLKRLARNGPFATCFMHTHGGRSGDSTPTLVDLDLFSDRFDGLAQFAFDEDLRLHVATLAEILHEVGQMAV